MRLIHGDCLEVLRTLSADTVDTVITDPPYGLTTAQKTGGFMGKQWDAGVPSIEYWQEILRVAKPGALLLAFGGSRTYHRLAVAIEDAGWEIRDCIMWVYSSGMPKGHNISKAIDKKAGVKGKVIGKHLSPAGNKTGGNSLKLSVEGMPSVVHLTAPATPEARLWEGWNTALKPAYEPICVAMKPLDGTFVDNALKHQLAGFNINASRVPRETKPDTVGRWPANLIHDGSDEVLERFPQGKSRFFYAAKPSKKERDSGLPDGIANKHPTVKPQKLMEYLCTLTMTPMGGVVLDPFMGSGSTGIACLNTGRDFIGIELEEESFRTAELRIQEAHVWRH